MTSGKHTWEIRIDRFNQDEDVFIGVALKGVNLYGRPPEISNFWGYIASNARKFCPGNEEDFGETSGTDDIIGVTLEFGESNATLSYTKNGSPMGVAFDNLPLETFYPAVSLYYVDVQVTILNKF
jgi:tripartite motif-containing protein 9/67